MGYSESVYAKAIELTRSVIEMTAAADSGHPSSAASLAHIVTVLMYDHMRSVSYTHLTLPTSDLV